jgi:hypothetical protein
MEAIYSSETYVSLSELIHRFGGTDSLYSRGRRVSQARSRWYAELDGSGLLFGPKDGGDMFLRNVSLSPNNPGDRTVLLRCHSSAYSVKVPFQDNDPVTGRRRSLSDPFLNKIDNHPRAHLTLYNL